MRKVKVPEKIIGHGTWYDKIAEKIVKRERKLGRSLGLIRVESGIGASGIPHIGSLAEVARNYTVSLALKEQGYNSEFIVFSDNKDGLRRIPIGFPETLQDYLGRPVTDIPDPFGCQKSFGDHMVYLLQDALDTCGVQYTLKMATDAYREGLLNEETRILLENTKRVGEIVREETGQEKFLEALPYFPVCSSCGRIYTTKAYEFLPEENRVLYVCEGMEIKGRWLEGCGYKGKADYTKGEGKLSWKAGEFAARWRALDIRFEACGKDISDSVRVNDRICREILGYEPPMHVQYEMFLDKGGKKLSKSVGNVLTSQIWLRYGSPQSMILLTLKRFVGTRNISINDIPYYMTELDELEDTYFGRKKIIDEKERTKLVGLYKYCWFMKPPQKPSVHVPYNLLIYLAKVAPKESETNFIIEKLKDIRYLKEPSADLNRRIEYALNWTKDFEEIMETHVELSSEEKNAVWQLIQTLQTIENPEELQNAIFDIARKNNLKPTDFFKIIYSILLGTPSGPRLGPYVIAIGKQNVILTLEGSLKENCNIHSSS